MIIANPSKSRFKGAFTLIELLVVIAIIALLAAILFPVFARARENARRSSCQSNLKQLALGMHQYTQDYDEKYPLASIRLQTGPAAANLSTFYWAQTIMPYVKNAQIYQCPSFRNTQGLQSSYAIYSSVPAGWGFQFGQYSSYGMNATLNKWESGPGWYPLTLSHINNASELALFAETTRMHESDLSNGHYPDANTASATACASANTNANCSTAAASSGWVTVIGSGPDYNTVQGYRNGDPYTGWPAVGPAVRHLETSNVAFADGHVKAMKYDALYRRPSGVTAANWKLWFPGAQ